MASDWLVSADDRTGALEVAAEVAAAWGRPVPVTVYPDAGPESVVDLGSRRCTAEEAADRAAVVARRPSGWRAHKFDSTLRGNWAAELRAQHAVSGRRVLVLAAWPEMGRTCVGGVVHVHGEAIGDLRDHLPESEMLEPSALARWLDDAGSGPFAACDVADTATMHAVAALAGRHEDVIVGGPAGPIGAVFAAWLGRPPHHERRPLSMPALVVCGSATAVAAAQVEELRRRRPDVDVITARPHPGGALDPAVAQELAREGRRSMDEHGYRTVVLVGGDTAASFLGDARRWVGGTVLPGLPWSVGDEAGVVVVTKAGAFGGVDTLVRVFDEEVTQ